MQVPGQGCGIVNTVTGVTPECVLVGVIANRSTSCSRVQGSAAPLFDMRSNAETNACFE